jgi:hypothetical protein
MNHLKHETLEFLSPRQKARARQQAKDTPDQAPKKTVSDRGK